jgi:biopolymer transport protein ExbB
MDFSAINSLVNNSVYAAEAAVALWGAFCVIVVGRRISQIRFRNEEEQSLFLDSLDERLLAGDFKTATEMCDNDDRAMSQLALLAISNRDIGYRKVRALITDRFQRDVLAEIEYRLSWVYTVIKSAPMLGLLGTVLGMMGAFGNLGSGQKVDTIQLANDISFALLTTVWGLTISIPLILATAYLNVRIRKLEDLVGVGVTRFLDTFKIALGKAPAEEKQP